MATCVVFLVTFFLFANGYRLPIKVFEISKTKHQDSRVDAQYYDPELTRHEKNYKNHRNNLAFYVIKSLQSENDDDYSDDENVFIDKTRSLPVIILPEHHAVNHKYRLSTISFECYNCNRKPRNYRILHKLLHSALRSDGVEDRTAPPRHHVNYEYDYY